MEEQKTITPTEVLNDPEFYELPEFERIKVLKQIDPEFESLPAVEQLKVVKAFEGKISKQEEKPFYEKAWRQFAHGSGELLKTAGEIVNKLSGLITPNPVMQAQGIKIGETLKTVGQETQDYWQADKEENKFKGTVGEIGNTLIREIPSLIAFSPLMNTTGRFALAFFKPTSAVGKSVVESVGSGAGYTAVNLAGREGYGLKDAGVDTLIDFSFGAGTPIVGRAISKAWDVVSSEVKELLGFARKVKDKKVREPVKEIIKEAKANNQEKLLEKIDNVLNSEDIPVEVKQSALKMKKKLQEDLPPPVKETATETTDAYIDIQEYKKVAPNVAVKITPKTFTPEEWGKEFSSPIDTPIGKVVMGKYQYKKMLDKRKRDLFPAIKPTLEKPLVIVEDKDGIVFIKPFILKRNGEKHIEFISVKKTIEGEDVIVSNHKIGDKKLEKLLKGKVLYKDSSLSRSAGVHPQTPSNNKLGNFDDTVKLYAGVPISDALKQLDNFELAIRKALKGNTNIGFWDKTFNDPEEVFKNIGKEKYYDLVKKAFERQTRLEKGYRKIMTKIRENLKTDTDKKLFEGILHIRDKYKVESINDIEKIIGKSLPENIKRAYIAFDNGMKWAARLLELDKVSINKKYKGVKPIKVKEFKPDKANEIDLETQFREMLKAKKFNNPQMRQLTEKLEANHIIYGYIPHVFHPYYVTDKNGNILATFLKETEAEKFIKANKDIVNPEVNQFKFKIVNAEELEDPVKFKEALKERMNRLSFHRYIGHKEKRKGVGGWENFPYLVYKDSQIIGRFNTKTKAEEFARKNNGQLVELKELPKKDIVSDTEWYLHKVARYRAMEDIKPKLVSWFNNEFSLNLPKNTPIEQLKQSIYKIQDPETRKEAEYIANFISDVLGRPQKSEEWLNEIFKSHPGLKRLAERLGIAYGDRAGLALLNKTHKGLTHIFLGFLKPIQLVVQLSTIPSNTWVLLAKQLADEGVKYDLTKASEYVAKAMFDFATNKKLRGLALKLVSDAPTIAEINQYTGKTFSKGTLENISLFFLITGDRLARAIAFLAKYEHLKDIGYKGNKAKVAKEFALQTNFNMKVYDTPPALRNPLIRFYMMFRPFLIKEINFLKRLPWKYRLAGSLMLMTFLGTHAFLGYEILDTLGITDKIYQLVGEPLEEVLSDVSGISREKLAELREFGLLGALTGISLYQNMGLGDIYSSIFTTSSAPFTYGKNILDMIVTTAKGDTEKAKESVSRLLPTYIRRVKDGLDILTKGYVYRNGRPVIKGSIKEAIALLLGATPIRLQKFYNTREELKGEKENRRIERERLMKQMYEAYVKNDKETVNKIARQLIEKGIYPNTRALQQGFKSYIYSIKVPKELQLLIKPEYRQYLLKRSLEERKKLLQKLKTEYEKEKDPIVKQAYIRAIRNVSSVVK